MTGLTNSAQNSGGDPSAPTSTREVSAEMALLRRLRPRPVAAVILITLIAVLGWRHFHPAPPPPVHVGFVVGGGLNAVSGVHPATPMTYTEQQIFNMEKTPITLLSIRPVDPTPGFHVLGTAVAEERKSSIGSLPGWPTRRLGVGPSSPLKGYSVMPGHGDSDPGGVLLMLGFQLDRPGMRAGFRGLRVDFLFQGKHRYIVLPSSFTVCSTTAGQSRGDAADWCVDHGLSPAGLEQG